MAYGERRQNGNGNGQSKLKKVGAMWKPKEGGKSCGSGNITIRGYRQRFVVLKNKHKTAGSNEPDWVLMSGDEPEVDNYQARGGRSEERDHRRDEVETRDDDVPF